LYAYDNSLPLGTQGAEILSWTYAFDSKTTPLVAHKRMKERNAVLKPQVKPQFERDSRVMFGIKA
jgi:hypothetical protein